jgi:hypothetical protein
MVNELLTIDEVRDILARVSGRDVRVRKRSPEEAEETVKTVLGQRFQLVANKRDLGAFADVAKQVQAKFGIPFTSLEETLQREKAHLLASLPAEG